MSSSSSRCTCGKSSQVPQIIREMEGSPSNGLGESNTDVPDRDWTKMEQSSNLLMMEASFVHLNVGKVYEDGDNSSLRRHHGHDNTPTSNARGSSRNFGQTSSPNIHSGLLDAAYHTTQLVKAARRSSTDGNFPCLCRNCVMRVIEAIKIHTNELEAEAQAYRDYSNRIASQEESYYRNNGEMVESSSSSGESNKLELDAVVTSYTLEIESLLYAKNIQKQELRLLNEQLLQEKQSLRHTSNQLYSQIPNRMTLLEFQANRAWSDDEQLLVKMLEEAETDLEHVCDAAQGLLSKEGFMFSIRPSSNSANIVVTPFIKNLLEHSQGVNQQGNVNTSNTTTTKPTKYSTINNLRLGFKPHGGGRDKLLWNEITTAWSQLAHALYFALSNFSTIYPSLSIFIEPVCDGCVKLIEIDKKMARVKHVHSLGVEKGSSSDNNHHHTDDDDQKSFVLALLSFYRLLYQVTSILMKSSPPELQPPPYNIVTYVPSKAIDWATLPETDMLALISIMATMVQWLLSIS